MNGVKINRLVFTQLAYFASMKLSLAACLVLIMSQSLTAQNYRGLSVLNDSIAWVSGSKGTVLRSTDGGVHWDTLNPYGYSRKDFRDIHAFDVQTAVVMSAGDSAVILRTEDGGKNWNRVYRNNRVGVFYDAMDFRGMDGVLVGDPYLQDSALRFDLLFSRDGGKTWSDSSSFGLPSPEAQEGEALFAASGSNIHWFTVGELVSFAFVSGGKESALYVAYKKTSLPFDTCPSCGAYSLGINLRNEMVMVGGNYLFPDSVSATAVYFDKKSDTWKQSEKPPGGYRSCVVSDKQGTEWVCTGLNGTDKSTDGGKTWQPVDNKPFNACAFSANFLWLAGNGQVTRLRK